MKSRSIVFMLAEVMHICEGSSGALEYSFGATRVHTVVEGGTGTNHRFRVANHHVYLTRSWGKLSSETHLEAIWWPWLIMVVEGTEERRGAA